MPAVSPGGRFTRAVALVIALLALVWTTAASAESQGRAARALQTASGPPQVTVDNQGRLVVAFGGFTCNADGFSECTPGLVVQRYLPNGRLDLTFGGDGSANISLGGVGSVTPFDIVIEPGNRIVVGASGAPGESSAGQVSLLVAFTSAGKPDPSFGDQGRQLVDDRLDWSIPGGLAMADMVDGGLVVTGYSYFASRPRFAVVRYAADGSLVQSFGDLGIVRGDFSDAQYTSGGTAISVDRSQRILVGGGVGGAFGLARLLSDGTFDTSFSEDGRTVVAAKAGYPATNYSTPTDIFELADAGILVAGDQNFGDHGGCSEIVSARLTADGTDQGVERHQEGCARVAAALLGPGEQLTTAGSTFNYFDPEEHKYLVRKPDGSTFTGVLDDPDGSALSDAALLPDGDLVLAGTVGSQTCAVGADVDGSSCKAMALKRVHPDGTVNAAFGDAGLLTNPSIDPVLDRSRFRMLIAQLLPEAVRAHRDRLTVPLRCPVEIRTGCQFRLALRARRGEAVALPKLSLDAGRTRRVVASVGDVDFGDHGNLRGTVFAPGQKFVGVNSRVKIRG